MTLLEELAHVMPLQDYQGYDMAWLDWAHARPIFLRLMDEKQVWERFTWTQFALQGTHEQQADEYASRWGAGDTAWYVRFEGDRPVSIRLIKRLSPVHGHVVFGIVVEHKTDYDGYDMVRCLYDVGIRELYTWIDVDRPARLAFYLARPWWSVHYTEPDGRVCLKFTMPHRPEVRRADGS